MILVDTSVWIDHLARGEPAMQDLLDHGMVVCHPLVIGELAMGDLHPRAAILKTLSELPAALQASHGEVLRLITQHKLYGRGVGYIDAHLLAAVRLTQGSSLWTRDRRLQEAADSLHAAFRRTP